MNVSYEEALEGFPVVVRIPVAWGEMDAFQHVNNTVFFRYFETVRIEFMRRLGFGDAVGPGGSGPILHSTSARFRRPLRFPDTVRVGARATKIHEDRFEMEYRVFSETQAAVVAEGTGMVVAYDYTAGAKTRLPESVRAGLERMG